MSQDPALLSAVELVDLYRASKLSPVEVTKAALARIARLNPRFNAFCLVDEPGGARRGAALPRRAGPRASPWASVDGVPATVKDLLITKGWPTLRGSKAVDPKQTWDEDAPSVARLREEGAVLLGKTTTPEFGWKGVTDSPLTGITRNPWNRDQDPRRLQRRGGGGRGLRHGRASSRHRWRRIDPHSRRLHRHLRAEAELWPRPGLALEPLRHAGPYRPDDAHGGRCGADADRHHQARSARLVCLSL